MPIRNADSDPWFVDREVNERSVGCDGTAVGDSITSQADMQFRLQTVEDRPEPTDIRRLIAQR
jgi:hypothetical protein